MDDKSTYVDKRNALYEVYYLTIVMRFFSACVRGKLYRKGLRDLGRRDSVGWVIRL